MTQGLIFSPARNQGRRPPRIAVAPPRGCDLADVAATLGLCADLAAIKRSVQEKGRTRARLQCAAQLVVAQSRFEAAWETPFERRCQARSNALVQGLSKALAREGGEEVDHV